jgi:hypothetical protein
MGSNIISWSPTGLAFKVHSRTAFEKVVMPGYFTSASGPMFRSFQRQLNIFGFRVVNDVSSPDFGQYRHPLFQRGKPELCAQMKREKIRSTNSKEQNAKSVAHQDTDSALLEFAIQANEFLALAEEGEEQGGRLLSSDSPVHIVSSSSTQRRIEEQDHHRSAHKKYSSLIRSLPTNLTQQEFQHEILALAKKEGYYRTNDPRLVSKD